tara:strand:+ start:99491 stop:100078 length:588 start_codon:yes stop_codon:yes gene_type:complete
MHPPRSKSELRAQLKNRLDGVSEQERTDASTQLCQRLIGTSYYQEAETILAYASMASELSLDPLIEHAISDGKTVCVPRIDWDHKAMEPAQIRNLDADLRMGRYGVRAPVGGCPLVEKSTLDLILIPGLGFDSGLRRLGRGAGFYDRMIDALGMPRPLMVGVCFGCQVIERVPTEAHDWLMDRVFAETGEVRRPS